VGHDGDGDGLVVLPLAGDLRGIPGAELGGPGEGEAGDVFQDGTLAGALVANDDKLCGVTFSALPSLDREVGTR
jgi:hypothetical protein